MPNQFEAAERIARRRGLTRDDVEALGVRSQALAKQAWEEGRFDREVLELSAPQVDKEGNLTGETKVVNRDQGLRDTTAESLARLKPVLEGGFTRPERLPSLRRRGRSPAHGRGQGSRARIEAARPHHRPGAGRLGTEFHLDGPVQATSRVLERAE